MARNPTKQEHKEEKVSDTAAKSGKKGKLPILVALLTLLSAGGGAAWYFLQGNAHHDAKAAAPKPPVFVNLEPFTVNLQPEQGDQYLQVGLALKVSDSSTVDQIKLYMPEIRSRILLLLSSKRASELITAEGKNKVSGEIAAEVKNPIAPQLNPQESLAVFFTSFVIQ